MNFDQFLAAAASALNASFTIAFVGGLTGAIGGALGAHRIVERSQKRKELLRELRYTNAAIMVAFSVCNAALALKKQHVQPRRETFQKAKSDLLAFKEKIVAARAVAVTEFRVQMDLSTYPAPIVPIESLKHMVYQELSVVGRPLALVAVIEQTLIGLSTAIAQRSVWAERFRSGEIPEKHREHHYFGLPMPGGHVNEEFSDLVEATYIYTDDLAMFSSQLCTDLMSHGAELKKSADKLSKRVPDVSTIDFSAAEKSGLMPDRSQYAQWLNAFVERKQK